MSNSTAQLIEDIDGAFHQLFRTAGITMKPDGDLERIRTIATQLANTIEHRGTVKAVEVIKVLQEGVKAAFEAMEADLETRDAEVKNKLNELESRIAELEQGQGLK